MKDDDLILYGTELIDLPLNMLAEPDLLYTQAMKMMWSMVQYKELQMMYVCAIKEVKTKFDVLSTGFNVRKKRNPINSISTRLKRTESIMNKLMSRKLPLDIDSIERNIYDVAGIRVICSYIDDIYELAAAFLKQDDIKLVERKDYIKNPKPNGYRSLHLIVCVPVFFADQKKEMNVEVQIRTIAMDFWASLEHQIKYKKDIPEQEEVISRLKNCADIIARTDEEMLGLRRRIETAADKPSEEEVLMERLRKLDVQID